MNNRFLLIIPLMLLVLPFVVPNSDLKITLTPIFFLNGTETLYPHETNFTELSFDIVGKNFNNKYLIYNISIKDAFPKEFKDSLFNISKTPIMLRILQEKVLWKSNLIDIRSFSGQNLSFLLGVRGFEEDGIEVYDGEYLKIMINTPTVKLEEKSFLVRFGDKIWEGNPKTGVIALVVVIIIFCFFWWKEDGFGVVNNLRKWKNKLFGKDIKTVEKLKRKYFDSDIEKVKKWKREQKERREQRMGEEEGW